MTTDDEVWSAIGDPTRRRLLDLILADGGGTATSLATRLPVTRQAVAKHLGVLERHGLVHGTAEGREKRFRVDEAQLAKAAAPARVGRLGLGRPPATHQEDRRVHREEHEGEGRMADILHRIGVLTESPEKVYDALTTVDGLAGWWTTDTKGDADRAASSSSGSRRSAASTWRCSRPSPARRSPGGSPTAPRSGWAPPSTGSSRQDGEYTIVLFKHEGWREPVEFMHHCSTKWGQFLMSLKSLVETGDGSAGAARRGDQRLALRSSRRWGGGIPG